MYAKRKEGSARKQNKQITSNKEEKRTNFSKHPEMIALRKKQMTESNEFADKNIFWAFDNKNGEFDAGMKKLGLRPDQIDELVDIAGGAMRKDKIPELKAMNRRHSKERSELRKKLKAQNGAS